MHKGGMFFAFNESFESGPSGDDVFREGFGETETAERETDENEEEEHPEDKEEDDPDGVIADSFDDREESW